MRTIKKVRATDLRDQAKPVQLWVCNQCGMKHVPDHVAARGKCTCGNPDGHLVEFKPGEQDA